jgi:hypothetical protein
MTEEGVNNKTTLKIIQRLANCRYWPIALCRTAKNHSL